MFKGHRLTFSKPMAYPYKCALITGATSGIGEAFSSLLAPNMQLLLTGRDESKLADLQERFDSEGHLVSTIAADLSHKKGRQAVLEVAKGFPIDLLINNAGLGAYGAFTEIEPTREMEMIEVNITAVIELTRSLLPAMINRAKTDNKRSGMIVVSSTATVMPIPFLATYAATKAFERHWGEALAEELKYDPVDILILCPGATRTNFFRRACMDDSILSNMEEPEVVARKGLNALGRHTVYVSNGPARLALSPTILPRRLITAGLGYFMRSKR